MPSKIEWTDETWNPVVGCTKCSPGCKNCYAERWAGRLCYMLSATSGEYPEAWPAYCDVLSWDGEYNGKRPLGWNGEVALRYAQLDKPLKWRKPRRIFVCSMGDLFHEKVPFEFIGKVYATMIGAEQQIFQVLTKRIARAAHFIPWFKNITKLTSGAFKNIHLGVSISNRVEADEKIPILLQIPAAIRWLSMEPMLEQIDVRAIPVGDVPGYAQSRLKDYLNWVAIGCESGPKRRPCKLEWIRSIVQQCKVAGVPVFVKQIEVNGKVSHNPEEWPSDLRIREYP